MSGIGAARHGIPARYGGVCVTCGAGYQSGDQITRHPHGWAAGWWLSTEEDQ